MTVLLQEAFARAARLPEAEQEVLAARLLAELAGEDEFDAALQRSVEGVATLARAAVAEHRAGKSQPLDPEQL